MNIESFKQLVLLVWNYSGVSFITLGVILNLVAALAVALRTGTFTFRVLGDFIFKQLAPYVLIYFAFSLLGEGIGLALVGPAVFAVIQAMLLASIIDKLKELGVPIPDAAMSLVQYPPKMIVLDGFKVVAPEDETKHE